MSRYSEPDDSEEVGPGQPPAWGRWEGAKKQAIGSRRGQAAIRDLIAALDALPQPRLIMSALCHRGEVCAIGALALHQRQRTGQTRRAALKSLPQHQQRDQNRHADADGGDFDLAETAHFAERHLGLTYTLAWEVAYANDEHGDRMRMGYELTPEERWQSVRAWALSLLKEPYRGGDQAEA